MNYSQRYFRLLVILLLLAGLSNLSPSWADLDPYYRQNGDAYLLIGENPTVGLQNVRGVYALNNLSTNAPQFLYDPQDSYGISASLVYLGPSLFSKDLYTFSGADTGLVDVTTPLERECRTTSQLTERHHGVTGNLSGGIHRIPESIAAGQQISVAAYGYSWQTFPGGYGYSKDTDGNGMTDTFYFYPMVFQRAGGPISFGSYYVGDPTYCAPCNIPLTAISGRPGWFYVNPNTWYHPIEKLVNNTGRPMTCREAVKAKFRDLSITKFNVNSLIGPTTLYPVASVKLWEERTVTRLAECGDPCAPGTVPYTASGTPAPYLGTVMSGFGRSYLYSRIPSATTFLLTAKNSDGTSITVPANNMRGDKNLAANNYLTTRFIGASARSITEDYVYFLGNETIGDWLATTSFTPPNPLNVVDCAVSDQWWLNGGIVYSYDKANGQVYQFVRNEASNSSSFSPIAVGSEYDSISTDGFGNLYLLRTVREPTAIANIGLSELIIASTTWGAPPPAPPASRYGAAYYRQKIFKGVTKRDYYGGGMTTLVSKVPIGEDYFCRTIEYPNWTSASNLSDTTKWVFLGALSRSSTPVTDQVYCELAVVNVNTPPEKTGNENGMTDIDGPFVLNGTALVPAITPFSEASPLFFQVENFPLLDSNGVNTRATGLEDINGNGFTGGFTSALASISYHWVIEQINDRYGIPATNPVKIFDRTDPTYNTVGLSFTAGKYNVWVQTKFAFYDYDLLTPGSTPASRSEILSPTKTAFGTTSDSPFSYLSTSGWAKYEVEIASASIASFPGGAGVVMSGRWDSTTFTYAPTTTDPSGVPTYIIEEGATWSFRLRDSLANTGANDRLAAIESDDPPVPNDPRAEDLHWTAPPTFKWTARLEHPTTHAGILISADIYPADPMSQSIEIPLPLVNRFLTIPSDPVSYILEVDATRFYEYKTFVITGQVQTGTDPVTGAPIFTAQWGPTTLRPFIQVKAQANVVVLDKTPPAMTLLEPYAQSSVPAMGLIARTTGPADEKTILWGTTGDSILSPEGKSNPTTLQFIVADNNPFGNLSQTNSFVDTHSGLSCKHNVSKRSGSFIYQTATGTSLSPIVLWADVSAPAQYRDDNGHGGNFNFGELALPSTLLSQTSPSVIYTSTTFSYLSYAMALSNLGHFSRDAFLGNAWSGKLPLNYANSFPGYANLTYGAYFTDSSGNTMVGSWTSAGIIVVRDNKRPNAAIQATDEKSLSPRLVPYLSGSFTSGYDRAKAESYFTSKDYTQVNELDPWGNSSIPTFFEVNWPWRPSGSAMFSFHSAIDVGYEQDIPIMFQSFLSDNVTASPTKTWSISGGQFTSPLTIGLNPWRYLFTQAATYSMNLTVNDTARGWPSNPTDPYNSALPQPNTRNLNLDIPIYATRLDLRVIEKQMR
ncbi:hypothetical protein AUK22_11640 [bacterium CG2_30_54_10]|nr:MAG: hypothetical protein AUK22_11640 [bacterium CG2_30_54_10]